MQDRGEKWRDRKRLVPDQKVAFREQKVLQIDASCEFQDRPRSDRRSLADHSSLPRASKFRAPSREGKYAPVRRDRVSANWDQG